MFPRSCVKKIETILTLLSGKRQNPRTIQYTYSKYLKMTSMPSMPSIPSIPSMPKTKAAAAAEAKEIASLLAREAEAQQQLSSARERIALTKASLKPYKTDRTERNMIYDKLRWFAQEHGKSPECIELEMAWNRLIWLEQQLIITRNKAVEEKEAKEAKEAEAAAEVETVII
jgi:hypothetical protein